MMTAAQRRRQAGERERFRECHPVGSRIYVKHEGMGTIVGYDPDGVFVRCDSDGVEVNAAYEQCEWRGPR